METISNFLHWYCHSFLPIFMPERIHAQSKTAPMLMGEGWLQSTGVFLTLPALSHTASTLARPHRWQSSDSCAGPRIHYRARSCWPAARTADKPTSRACVGMPLHPLSADLEGHKPSLLQGTVHTQLSSEQRYKTRAVCLFYSFLTFAYRKKILKK